MQGGLRRSYSIIFSCIRMSGLVKGQWQRVLGLVKGDGYYLHQLNGWLDESLEAIEHVIFLVL